MRLSIPRAAFAALVLPLAAASCSSADHYPASPVPAAMTEIQAMRLAQPVLADRGAPPGIFTDVIRTGDGFLVGYKTDFEPSRQPPREYHLVVVRNNGTVFDQVYREGH